MVSVNESAQLNINEVILPKYSFGTCKYWKRCKNFQVELGNGLCMGCYDKGLEGSDKELVQGKVGK